MKKQLQDRLTRLREEFESGQKMLQELQLREDKLRESLLRISGAIQVLEEELTKESEASAPSSPVRAVV